jgi:hypothetical protein
MTKTTMVPCPAFHPHRNWHPPTTPERDHAYFLARELFRRAHPIPDLSYLAARSFTDASRTAASSAIGPRGRDDPKVRRARN